MAIFNFAINDSHVAQAFFLRNGNPIRLAPNTVIDTNLLRTDGGFAHVLTPISNFLAELKRQKTKRFYLQRTFALGDMLMMVPVVRYLKKVGYDPYIHTLKEFGDMLRFLEIEYRIMSQGYVDKHDCGIIFDGLIESDHYRQALQSFHRVETYFKVLGIKEPRNLDWSCRVDRLPKIERPEKYVVFQGQGSTYRKSLPHSTISRLVELFRKDHITVVVLGRRFMPLFSLFSLINHAECLVCMDSSPLWISHFTKTPVVGIFGPSRPSERITRHPLYPKKAIGISLNEIVKCEPCFEGAQRCNQAMQCLHVKPEKIYELLRPEVLKFWRS